MLGRPQQQRAPARTDIQKTLAGLEHQLAADVIELGFLGLRQRHRGVAQVAVISARIHPARVQPQRVEGI